MQLNINLFTHPKFVDVSALILKIFLGTTIFSAFVFAQTERQSTGKNESQQQNGAV